MKKLLAASALALSFFLLPTPSGAADCCPPNYVTIKLPVPQRYKIDAGFSFHLKAYPACSPCGPGGAAGPWYLYWPLEAHFVQPAPTGYPYWPSPMTLPGAAGAHGHPPAPAPGPVATPAPAPAVGPTVTPTHFQRTGYQGYAPSYWYGR